MLVFSFSSIHDCVEIGSYSSSVPPVIGKGACFVGLVQLRLVFQCTKSIDLKFRLDVDSQRIVEAELIILVASTQDAIIGTGLPCYIETEQWCVEMVDVQNIR